MEAQKKMIVKFLEIHTNHQAGTAKIRKSPAPQWDYVVRVQSHARGEVMVNFVFQDDMLYYGIAGFGICSAQPISKLID
jgi:hypothetical protein